MNVSAGTVPALPVNVGAATPPAGVYEFIASDGWDTVPTGVMLFEPPVAPTFPAIAVVPITVNPASALFSVYPAGQEPDVMMSKDPEGGATGVQSAPPIHTHVPEGQEYMLPFDEFSPTIRNEHTPVGTPVKARVTVFDVWAHRPAAKINNRSAFIS